MRYFLALLVAVAACGPSPVAPDPGRDSTDTCQPGPDLGGIRQCMPAPLPTLRLGAPVYLAPWTSAVQQGYDSAIACFFGREGYPIKRNFRNVRLYYVMAERFEAFGSKRVGAASIDGDIYMTYRLRDSWPTWEHEWGHVLGKLSGVTITDSTAAGWITVKETHPDVFKRCGVL